MTLQELIKIQVAREFLEKNEAQRWEANFVLQAEKQADHDYEAYQRFQKERGFA